MELERWIEHPFSDTETWLINGWFILAVDRREVIEMVTGTFQDFLLLKVAPAAFLSMPVHDTPKAWDPLQKMREKIHEQDLLERS